jgi:hypothetical protein
MEDYEEAFDHAIEEYFEARLFLPKEEQCQVDASLKFELNKIDDWEWGEHVNENQKYKEKIEVVKDLTGRLVLFRQAMEEKLQEEDLSTMMMELVV